MPITHGSVILLLNKNQKILECISDESYLGNKIDTIYKNKVLKIKNAYSPVLDYCHNLSKSLFYVNLKKRNI